MTRNLQLEERLFRSGAVPCDADLALEFKRQVRQYRKIRALVESGRITSQEGQRRYCQALKDNHPRLSGLPGPRGPLSRIARENLEIEKRRTSAACGGGRFVSTRYTVELDESAFAQGASGFSGAARRTERTVVVVRPAFRVRRLMLRAPRRTRRSRRRASARTQSNEAAPEPPQPSLTASAALMRAA